MEQLGERRSLDEEVEGDLCGPGDPGLGDVDDVESEDAPHHTVGGGGNVYGYSGLNHTAAGLSGCGSSCSPPQGGPPLAPLQQPMHPNKPPPLPYQYIEDGYVADPTTPTPSQTAPGEL